MNDDEDMRDSFIQYLNTHGDTDKAKTMIGLMLQPEIDGQDTALEKVVIDGEVVWVGEVPTNNRGNICNKYNMVQPWDDEVGFRGFGFDNTYDVFGKLSYKPTNKLRFNLSYWSVAAHRKIFSTRLLY